VKITDDMVWTKRPGTGIPPKDINKVIGRRSNIHINKNTLLSWDQLI
jgi:sialic acid synthase SpsE